MMPTTTVTKSKLTMLKLVYPPISNQEAVWLQDDPEVEAELRASDFYMIAGRQEVKFGQITADPNTHFLTFTISLGNRVVDAVQIQPHDMLAFAEKKAKSFCVKAGEKFLRFWDESVDGSTSDAFSKKVENRAHSVAIHTMHYNFVRIHQTLRCTPAMAAGDCPHQGGELLTQ